MRNVSKGLQNRLRLRPTRKPCNPMLTRPCGSDNAPQHLPLMARRTLAPSPRRTRRRRKTWTACLRRWRRMLRVSGGTWCQAGALPAACRHACMAMAAGLVPGSLRLGVSPPSKLSEHLPTRHFTSQRLVAKLTPSWAPATLALVPSSGGTRACCGPCRSRPRRRAQGREGRQGRCQGRQVR